jgi:hypothetical protein
VSARRPGNGFVGFVAVCVSAGTMLAWGLRTPPLDDVWRLQLELKIGASDKLTVNEVELFQETLTRYPDLAEHMLEGADSGLISVHIDGVTDRGYAYLVRRRAQVGEAVRISAVSATPVEVEVFTANDRDRGVANGDRSCTLSLDENGPFPQFVGVHLVTPDNAASRSDNQAPFRVELVER